MWSLKEISVLECVEMGLTSLGSLSKEKKYAINLIPKGQQSKVGILVISGRFLQSQFSFWVAWIVDTKD